MTPVFRRIAVALLSLLLAAPAFAVLGTADASETSPAAPATTIAPAVVLPVEVATTTTAAPVVTTTAAPVVKVVAPAPKPAAKVIPTTTEAPVEIGTACTMTRNADGSVTSEGC